MALTRQATTNYVLTGLNTFPNQISEVPTIPYLGCSVAQDCVIYRDGMISPRRGFQNYINTSTAWGNILAGIEYLGYIVAWTSNNYIIYTEDGVSWTAMSGTFLSPNPTDPTSRVRFFQENNNLYFLTSLGVYSIDAITATPQPAGLPPALDGFAVLNNATPDGFLDSDASTAYRIEWQYLDANNNLIVSAPSDRIEISNTNIGTQTIAISGSPTLTSPTGLALYNFINGSVTSGTFTANETITQATSGATAHIVGTVPSGGPIIVSVSTITGTPTATNVWTGNTSGATFTPTSLPTYLTYDANIFLNGATNYPLAILGSNAATYEALLTQINTVISPVATATLTSSGILISSTLIQGSAVLWTDGGGSGPSLAASLLNFSGILAPQDGARNVQITFQIPYNITVTYPTVQYAIYRSLQSAGADVPANDDEQLVTIATATPAQIAASSITYLDTTSDFNLGLTIDTATSQETTAGANILPPLAVDVEQFRGYTFYANIQSPYEFGLNLQSVNVSGGMQIGDLITFTAGSTTVILTAGITESASSNTFLLSNTGVAATDIQLTAQSIVRVFNTAATNNFADAFYVSISTTAPGQMVFQSGRGATVPGSSFYVNYSGASTVFSVPISATGSNQNNTAVNTSKQNRIMISKYNQPWAVPIGVPGGIIDVGSENVPILRIMANRNVVFVFKGAQEGIFYITGTGQGVLNGQPDLNFQLQPFDQTVHMTVANSAALLNNSVYFFSDVGVVSVNDGSGVTLQSRPIERDLLQIASYPNFAATCFGASYPSDREYILAVPQNPTDTTATIMYVNNWYTNQASSSWTTWQRPSTWVYLRPSNNELYFAQPNNDGSCTLKVERKTFTNADYVDETSTFTISSIISTTRLGVTSTSDLSAGQIITQGGAQTTIVSVNTSFNQVVVDSTSGFIVGSALAATPIEPLIITNQFNMGMPDVQKRFSEVGLMTLGSTWDDLELGFTTDGTSQQGIPQIDFGSQYVGDVGWGEFLWGTMPWGIAADNNIDDNRLRTYVPQGAAYANWIRLTISATLTQGPLNLMGLNVTWRPVTQRMF